MLTTQLVIHALTVVRLFQCHNKVPLVAAYPKRRKSTSEAINNLSKSHILSPGSIKCCQQ